MESLRDKCAIVGIGFTRFSSNSGVSVMNLALEACKKAIEDAGLTNRDVDAVLTYNMSDSVPATEVATGLGLSELNYHLDQWAGGNASSGIVITAAMAVATGMCKYAVCFRAMNGRSGFRMGGGGRGITEARGEDQFLAPYGWTSWAHSFAMFFRRHMHKYGTKAEQLGHIAVACRKHACLNERAMQRKPLTLEEYMQEPMRVDPFRKYDICLETDGACAVVVTTAERARDLRHRPVYIMGAGYGGGPLPNSYGLCTSAWLNWPDHTESYAKYIAPQLWGMAGVSPEDIDVAEVYDCFTGEVLIQLEDLGFCKKGEGGAFVEGGRIELGGELPVNTHGGHLSEAYIHGLNHVVEAVSQLRGDAGPRQVKDAELALTTGFGYTVGSAMILRR
ncbi:MAG TPA: acetyl-CoA acetyltransferase [Dehalococcoidia bacterium]|nr:acetyl-CoA acetyltransferase [Dehalococcoidia bacterium]